MKDFFNIQEGDRILGKQITKITEKSFWLSGQRHGRKSIDKMLINGNLSSKQNLDIKVDWKRKEDVLVYYNSFEEWCFYISMGDIKNPMVLIEVKDGLVFYDNEYWLPAPKGNYNKPNQKNHISDGWYNARLIKKENNWFGNNNSSHQSNVYVIESSVNVNPSIDDIKKLKPKSGFDKIYCRTWGSDILVDYEHSGLEGLKIRSIYVNDFYSLFKSIYTQSVNHPTIIISESILDKIVFGKELDDYIVPHLNRILNNSSYEIEANEYYGEFIFDGIMISKRDTEEFLKVIQDRLDSL